MLKINAKLKSKVLAAFNCYNCREPSNYLSQGCSSNTEPNDAKISEAGVKVGNLPMYKVSNFILHAQSTFSKGVCVA